MDEFERPKTRVQWLLGNNCNYNCSYCLDLFKRGDMPFPEQEVFLETCKDIIYHYDDLGRDVVFEFMGGEPTLIDKIPEIGQRLHNFPTNILLRTNGSASLEWWQRSKRYLSEVVISVHREFADLNHIKNVVELLKNDKDLHEIKLQVLFPVTLRPESWEWGFKFAKQFRKRYGVGELQMLYSNFGRGSDMHLPYKKYQWQQYHDFMGTKMHEGDFIPLKETYPQYSGKRCFAGLDILTIDPKGNIARSWCGQEPVIGNIYNPPIRFPTEPIICKQLRCSNGFDRNAKKV